MTSFLHKISKSWSYLLPHTLVADLLVQMTSLPFALLWLSQEASSLITQAFRFSFVSFFFSLTFSSPLTHIQIPTSYFIIKYFNKVAFKILLHSESRKFYYSLRVVSDRFNHLKFRISHSLVPINP